MGGYKKTKKKGKKIMIIMEKTMASHGGTYGLAPWPAHCAH